MNPKFMPATATAIALLFATTALADDNFSNIDQSGSDNDGSVEQGPGDGNFAGTESMAATQAGNENILEFDQSGSSNEIGTDGGGFSQVSNRNSATIKQETDGNRVLEVRQTGIGSGAGGASVRRNTLTIEQRGGDGNTVASVTQARTNGFFTNSRPGNEAKIVQEGGGNTVEDLFQDGRGNEATIGQQGDDNVVNHLVQEGPGNEATVDVVGDGNTTDIGQLSALFGNGAAATVTSGDDNTVWIGQAALVSGNLADVSITDGDRNQVGILQTSLLSGNEANVSITDGDDNTVWIAQFDDDFADVGITGDRNRVAHVQAGRNLAETTIVGDGNVLDAEQLGDNTLRVDIFGDGNNAGAFTPGRPAALKAGGLTPGRIAQTGSGNEIDVDVGEPDAPADDNLFAFSQSGEGNTIQGNVAGVGNEVAIVQNGSNNLSSFSQMGNHNVIGIRQ